jgi:hypothetical protein
MVFHVQEPVRESAMGIVDMVRRAGHKRNRIAMVAGFVAGGWIPTVTYLVSQGHVQQQPQLWLLVAGVLTYSAMTVFSWAKIAFRHPIKAVGFVVLLESGMTFVSDLLIGLPSLGPVVFHQRTGRWECLGQTTAGTVVCWRVEGHVAGDAKKGSVLRGRALLFSFEQSPEVGLARRSRLHATTYRRKPLCCKAIQPNSKSTQRLLWHTFLWKFLWN